MTPPPPQHAPLSEQEPQLKTPTLTCSTFIKETKEKDSMDELPCFKDLEANEMTLQTATDFVEVMDWTRKANNFMST